MMHQKINSNPEAMCTDLDIALGCSLAYLQKNAAVNASGNKLCVPHPCWAAIDGLKEIFEVCTSAHGGSTLLSGVGREDVSLIWV